MGFNKKAIKVDVEAATMTVDNKDVVNVQIEDNMMKIVWLDQTWKE